MINSTCKETHKCFGGEVRFHTHESKMLGRPANFTVYQPPQFRDRKNLPVIFTLAGLTCDDKTFLVKSGAVEEASRLGIFLVAPDTSPRGCGIEGEEDEWDFGTGASFYLDATRSPWSEHYQMASYLREELPALLQKFYVMDFTRCGIMGHSMGGHGALVHALRDPQMWKSVSAFAPITHPSVVPWGEKAFKGYIGEDRKLWRHYDAVCLLEDGCRFPRTILVDQGLEDPFLERELQPWHLQEMAQKVDQKLILREHPGYDHSYWFVQSFIADHMRHHASILMN